MVALLVEVFPFRNVLGLKAGGEKKEKEKIRPLKKVLD